MPVNDDLRPPLQTRLKRHTFEVLLRELGRAVVTLECDGCVLPTGIANDEGIAALDIWPTAPTRISDLVVDANGFSGTLSFNRTGFHCLVPWERVISVADYEGTFGYVSRFEMSNLLT